MIVLRQVHEDAEHFPARGALDLRVRARIPGTWRRLGFEDGLEAVQLVDVRGIQIRRFADEIAGILRGTGLRGHDVGRVSRRGKGNMKRSLAALALFTALAAGGSTAGERTIVAMPLASGPATCAIAQEEFTGTGLPFEVVMHPDFESFKLSKSSAKPFVIHGYVQAEAVSGIPQRVSCKTKTADLLQETWGADTAAATARSCRDLNRGTVMAVWQSLDAAQRARVTDRPDRILLEADTNAYMGSRWITDYPFVWRDVGGELHVHSKSLIVNWDDWKFAWAPDRIRGVRYCHLIAPEYLRAIMLGDVVIARAERS